MLALRYEVIQETRVKRSLGSRLFLCGRPQQKVTSVFGLAIVKHVTQVHNARIQLNSSVDVGTKITVEF